MNIKKWIEDNCVRKDGHLNNHLTKNNGEKISNKNQEIHRTIIEKTDHLKEIYQDITFTKRLYHLLNYDKKGWYKKESYYRHNIKDWVNENLIDTRGRISTGSIRNNQKRLKVRFPNIYQDIINSTKFLDKESPSFPQRLWHIYYNIYVIIKCKECEHSTTFNNFKKGYLDFCSYKCNRNSQETIKKTKETCLDKYGNEIYYKTDNFKHKSKQTCLERHGVEHYNNMEQIKQTKKERHGDENYNNREQCKETCLDKYGVEWPCQSEGIKEKSKQIRLERYGDENYVNIDKIKQTCLERYGVENPMHVPEIVEKTMGSYKNSWHDHILPSGKQIKLQGYEPKAFDELLNKYNEDDILYKKSDMPEIWYHTSDTKKHRYYPDFYIPKDNLIVEVKSTYTYQKYKEINLLKEEATKKLGYDYNLIIYK